MSTCPRTPISLISIDLPEPLSPVRPRLNSVGMRRGCRRDAVGAIAPSGPASPTSLRIMDEEVCAGIDLPGGQWMHCGGCRGCGPRSARGRGNDLQWSRSLPGGDFSAASRSRTHKAVSLPTHGAGWVDLPNCVCITPAESSRESPHSQDSGALGRALRSKQELCSGAGDGGCLSDLCRVSALSRRWTRRAKVLGQPEADPHSTGLPPRIL